MVRCARACAGFWALSVAVGGALAATPLHAEPASVASVAPVAPADKPPPGATPRSDGCEACHAAIVDEWRESFHRRAFVDPTFRRALAIEPAKEHAFCVGCHAPNAAQEGVAIGVACHDCHQAPHASPVQLAGDASCAPCHEFDFGDGRPELVQRTMSEHLASRFSTASCADCHMPRRDGHRDHRFISVHNAEKLRQAVSVRARRLSEREIEIEIDPHMGHAFPTGDMFRQATLRVRGYDAQGVLRSQSERVYGQVWGAEVRGPHKGRRKLVHDSRIVGVRRERVALHSEVPIVRVRYELWFQRVLIQAGRHQVLSGQQLLAQGEVP